MDQLPSKVLNWLHSVLIGEYFDVDRTFSDIAQLLKTFHSLRPSTDVYTFENGSSSLLLHISGTLPVSFRDQAYSFPLSIWIPRAYPREVPIVFVVPTRHIALRAGQHVGGDGRVYHPYIAGWHPEKSSLFELLTVLQGVFALEPPVIAKQAQVLRSETQFQGQVPPRPPLPPELRSDPRNASSSTGSATTSDAPPVPPPKPFQQHPAPNYYASGTPPVPPRPLLSRPQSQFVPANAATERFVRRPISHFPPPRPPGLQHEGQPTSPIQGTVAVPLSVGSTTTSSAMQYQRERQPEIKYGTDWHGRAQDPTTHPGWSQSDHRPANEIPYRAAPTAYQQMSVQQPLKNLQSQRQPIEDLLSSPFDPPLPTQPSENAPAPPIPPNPEKDALLSAISHNLTSQLRSIVASNSSALQPLAAQHAAVQNSMRNLQQEHGALLSLQELLKSNENILHIAMRDADNCIANARHSTVPGVDEVLVAPTVVGQQLYDLVAEEKACVETREVLGKALDRGRISSETWVKTVRSLAREEFLKKVVIRKCADGMGLQS